MANTTYSLWIGGEEKAGSFIFDVEDPSTGQIFAHCHGASTEEVDQAVQTAHKAYKSGSWSRAPRSHRAEVLDAIAARLQSRLDELIALEVRQTGRAVREMQAQVPSLVKWFKYYSSVLRTEERPVLPTVGQLHNWVDRVPIGVVALITPFNHPLLIATKKIAPALAGGNAIVLKPSELTPITAVLLGRIFQEAGLPDGVFNVVLGDGVSTGKALVEHPLVSKVDVTGSTSAGSAIGAIAGRKLNSFTAELGGKAPVIVFEKADVDLAVNGIAFGSFIASGQTCIAATRILVQKSVMEHLLPKLRAKCESIATRMGSPNTTDCTMGPLVSERQLNNVISLVDEAVSQGVNVVYGGSRMTGKSSLDNHDFGKGYYYPPTVLTDGKSASILDTRLWREEAFGPVIVLVGFDDEDEAVALANDSEFGLGAGLWTSDVSQAFRVAGRIEAGITWVNTHHRNDPSSPWGGFGSSGVGSENGIAAYHAYTKMKSTIINYATTEEGLNNDDWFSEGTGNIRYG